MPPRPLPLEPVVRTARPNAVTALAANPWAPLVAVGGQKQVLLYNTDTLDLLGVLPFPEGTPNVLKFSRNGSLLLAGGGAGGKSGRVVVWSVKTGERVFEVGDETDAVLAADISPDQTQIALGGPSKVIRIYSTRDGKLVREIKKHTDWVTALEFSPDGVLLATRRPQRRAVRLGGVHGPRVLLAARPHRRHHGGELAAGLATCSPRAARTRRSSCGRWKTAAISRAGGRTAAARSGFSSRTTAGWSSCGRDRVSKVWDGNGAQQRAFEAFPDVALRATFSHDGSRVIAGDWTGLIKVWAAADGKPLGTLTANPPTVAERLDAAQKDLAAKTAAVQPLTAAATASQAAATKAAADLAAAQQSVTTTAAAAKAAAEALPKAKAALDQANAALAAAQAPLAARQVTATAYAEAAAKIKAAADAAGQDKELAAASMKAQAVTAQTVADLAQTQKAVADTTAAAKTANDQYAAAQKLATDSAAAAAAAPKMVATLTPVAKAAADKAAADKAALDQAAAAMNAAKVLVDKLTATVKK